MSAQPVHQEPDPRDPQVIHGRLPQAERAAFLRQYRTAADAARDDLGKYRDLQRMLDQWRLVAEAANDPGYRDALNEARAAEAPGMTIEQLAATRPAR